MPAAAVIPAPLAYAKVAAVKKLVVEPWAWGVWFNVVATALSGLFGVVHFTVHAPRVTVKKLECLKQAVAWIHQHGITG